MKLGEIAYAIGATLAPENSDLPIRGVAPLEEASPGDISFLIDKKYSSLLTRTRATAVVLRQIDLPASFNFVPLVVEDIQLAVVKLLNLFNPFKEVFPPGVSPKARIPDSAKIGKDVAIADFAYIGDNVTIGDGTRIGVGVYIGNGVRIGKDCIIYPNVVIREGCQIGSRVIIQPGAVIGSDGFGYYRGNGRTLKVPQIGSVIIEDDCEIGANTTIDRGTITNTIIGAGSKLDNLIHIAHNVRLGRDCFLAAQVGISGSTVVEDEVSMGGQVGIVGHIRVGKGTRIGAQSGVHKSVPARSFIFGYPAKEKRRAMREMVALSDLPEFMNEVKRFMKEFKSRYGQESENNRKGS